VKCSICSRWYLCPSSGAQKLYIQLRVLVRPLLPPADIVEELEVCSNSSTLATGSSKGLTSKRSCIYSFWAPDDGRRCVTLHLVVYTWKYVARKLPSDEAPHPGRMKSLIVSCESLKTRKTLRYAAACRTVHWQTTFTDPRGWQKIHFHPESGETTNQHANNDYLTKHYMPYIVHSLREHYIRSITATVFLDGSFFCRLNLQKLRKGAILYKHSFENAERYCKSTLSHSCENALVKNNDSWHSENADYHFVQNMWSSWRLYEKLYVTIQTA
jgi:hypothetical protein